MSSPIFEEAITMHWSFGSYYSVYSGLTQQSSGWQTCLCNPWKRVVIKTRLNIINYPKSTMRQPDSLVAVSVTSTSMSLADYKVRLSEVMQPSKPRLAMVITALLLTVPVMLGINLQISSLQQNSDLEWQLPLANYHISSHFGHISQFRQLRAHKGTDFVSASGTPVLAVAGGIVRNADNKSLAKNYGNTVLIDHPGGYHTLYAHLQGFTKEVEAGSLVKQGQTIGYLGNTGLSQARHLHYEVHKNGKPINPLSIKNVNQVRLSGTELARFKQTKANLDVVMAKTKIENNQSVTLFEKVAEAD